MLKLEDIKKGLASVDNRPFLLWEGPGDGRNAGDTFRIVLTKKNTLVVEVKSGHNAMDQVSWIKTTDSRVDAEVLSKVLMTTIQELNKYLSV